MKGKLNVECWGRANGAHFESRKFISEEMEQRRFTDGVLKSKLNWSYKKMSRIHRM